MKSTYIERLIGYADILLNSYKVQNGDVVFVVSNSGRNALPVEMALGAKERGASVVAITNVTHSSMVSSRHSSGKKLLDIADVVIDTSALIKGSIIIGRNNIVGKNVKILGNVIIGDNTVIDNGAIIEGGTIIGNNCTIKNYCYVCS